MSDARNLDVERAIELLATARRVLDDACAKLCSVRHDAARVAYREISHLSRRAVIVRDQLDADFYATPAKERT